MSLEQETGWDAKDAEPQGFNPDEMGQGEEGAEGAAPADVPPPEPVPEPEPEEVTDNCSPP